MKLNWYRVGYLLCKGKDRSFRYSWWFGRIVGLVLISGLWEGVRVYHVKRVEIMSVAQIGWFVLGIF